MSNTTPEPIHAHRPRLSALAIWNMCVGFFGIQIGFGLQNANTSRIFQTLGAEVDTLAILWIAAPLTGLLVQPIIGHFSDRTWTRFGRRRPYFLVGAILTTLALIYDRWWLLLAAGAQLIAVSTHLAGLAGSDALLWSIVSTRMVVWFELMLLALFGVWEARNAPYATFKSRRAPDRAPYKVQTR